MAESLTWSAAQWERVNREVTEAFDKANVVGKFLPKYGPLPDSAEYVKDETLNYALDELVDVGSPGTQLSVSDDTSLKLFNLTVHVVLSREQVSEESLSSALLAFRRGANMLAQAEDRLVFRGHDKANVAKAQQVRDDAKVALAEAQKSLDDKTKDLDTARAAKEVEIKVGATDAVLANAVRAEVAAQASVSTAEGVFAKAKDDLTIAIEKLRDEEVNQSFGNPSRKGLADKTSQFKQEKVDVTTEEKASEDLVRAVAAATAQLENDFHPGPFACVLGTALFKAAHRPAGDGLVLPAERIKPMLNTNSATVTGRERLLFQCGQLPKSTGVVVALAGSDIDLVIATPPRVELLQITARAKYLFRVYEKFIWRVKDPRSAIVLVPDPPTP